MILFLKITPVILLSVLMLLSSLDVGALGNFELDMLVIAPMATAYAMLLANRLDGTKFTDLVDAAVENVKEMQLVFFILMMAYALAEAFMSTGVGAAVINISLGLGVSARTIAPVALIVAAILSVATGSSWGTFAATAPIFLWLNHIIDGDVILVIGATIGGACFGDNIGLISDTTVVSSGIQGVEVIDRIRHQGVWSIGCLLLAAVVFLVAGLGLSSVTGSAEEAIGAISDEAWAALEEERPAAIDLLNQVVEGVPYYMVIPLIVVIGTAIIGLPTLACLGLGLGAAYILGMIAGTTDTMSFLNDIVYVGFEDAGAWVIVMMMWVGAFGGVMAKMDAFKPLSDLVSRKANSVRQLMFYNGLLSLAGNAMLADEMAQIVTIGPIIRTITEHDVVGSEEDMYKLALRNATFSDALGVYGSQLIPWHVYIAFFLGIANAVYPLREFTYVDLIIKNYMSWIAVASILILTRTGLDNMVPLFGLPNEPDVQLKKNVEA